MKKYKITTIQPLKTRWSAPPENAPWDNNSFSSFTRLLRSDAFHIDDAGIPLNSDIYFISSYDISLIKKEIELAKKLKSLGKKLVVSYSQDMRFLVGNALVDNTGTHFAELCEHADVILSGLPDWLRVYGRYQNKVIEFGLPFERLNFSNKTYEQREIDLFIANNLGDENFGITTELLFTLCEVFAYKRIVYSTNLKPNSINEDLQSRMEFVPAGLMKHLPNSKVFISPEPRPRPARGLLEAWYCRTPFISCETAYYSKLFPDYSFKINSICDIVDNTIKLYNSDYTKVIQEAEEIAEFDYFDNFYPRLINKLYGE